VRQWRARVVVQGKEDLDQKNSAASLKICFVRRLGRSHCEPPQSGGGHNLAPSPSSVRENGPTLKEHPRTGAREVDPLLKPRDSTRDRAADRAFGSPVDDGSDQASRSTGVTADPHGARPMCIAADRPPLQEAGLLAHELVVVEPSAIEADLRCIELRNVHESRPRA
jgi:hypothetical protein